MKQVTENAKAKILKRYTVEEIRTIFAKRLDDDLLASVGVLEMGVVSQRHSDPHIAVWKGYEILTDSRYLNL
jgi:hypothetical protein